MSSSQETSRQAGAVGVLGLQAGEDVKAMVLTMPKCRARVMAPLFLRALALSPHLLGVSNVSADVGYIENGRRASTGYSSLGLAPTATRAAR